MMKITDALDSLTRIFIDTAPIIYHVENNPQYAPLVDFIFGRVDAGAVTAVTSPVTLAECLVVPYRLGLASLQIDFFDFIVSGRNTVFTRIDQEVGREAAQLRARYNLTLPDALQVAAALQAR